MLKYKLGLVIKKNLNRTWIVKSPYLKYNSKYKLNIILYKTYFIYDFGNEALNQDWILFWKIKPKSKLKSYKLSKIIKKSNE
uniref:30S ribosomal protein S17 n=1 Tax=Nephromyces sp. ex Molgula occidentalis TaxID=2544991 RepID=A0A5C1H8J5_9APIC|nr:30S ribosomal protein S17 [Nephromyces sp. ex Molgula occidentalis]